MSRMLKRSNRSFIRGLFLGLSISLVYILYEHYTWLLGLTEIHYSSRVLLHDHQVLSKDYIKTLVNKVGSAEAAIRSEVRKTNTSNVVWPDRDGFLHKLLDSEDSDAKPLRFEDKQHHHDNESIAKDLYHNIRVACWILTSPKNLMKKAIHVKNTWAKRCNKYLFMSSVANRTFPVIGLDVSEGREHLTAKTMKAFKYMYDHHLNDADWFVKADDDTYFILENLRYFLSGENPKLPVYFGQRFKLYVKQGYASGGGGYVLSKEALKRFGTTGFNNTDLCAIDKGAEDLQMGKCLQSLGVRLKPALDAMGRSRFHCLSPEHLAVGALPKWYTHYDWDRTGMGLGNISDYPISFHYVSTRSMYALEYYTYHLQAYGIIHKLQALNRAP